MTYAPCPIDTSSIRLSPAIEALVERLAKNAHDLWAVQRLNDGWSLGANRNDMAKTHPCLLPYEDLPESEKVYDRSTAIGTLKAIVALGYDIVPPSRP
jgi:hypothetical protein